MSKKVPPIRATYIDFMSYDSDKKKYISRKEVYAKYKELYKHIKFNTHARLLFMGVKQEE